MCLYNHLSRDQKQYLYQYSDTSLGLGLRANEHKSQEVSIWCIIVQGLEWGLTRGSGTHYFLFLFSFCLFVVHLASCIYPNKQVGLSLCCYIWAICCSNFIHPIEEYMGPFFQKKSIVYLQKATLLFQTSASAIIHQR